MDRDSKAGGEFQAALGILRRGWSLRELSKMRAAFGQVFQSCQGLDRESPRRVPFITLPAQRASVLPGRAGRALGSTRAGPRAPACPFFPGHELPTVPITPACLRLLCGWPESCIVPAQWWWPCSCEESRTGSPDLGQPRCPPSCLLSSAVLSEAAFVSLLSGEAGGWTSQQHHRPSSDIL